MTRLSPPYPLVSIGMPVYNGQRYVAEAIESLLRQTFGDFEIIISDNASSDQTETVCRDYAGKDERVRYFRNEKNLGAAKNFNRVFELSKGKYFKWAASDDLCDRVFLQRCLDVLETEPQVVLAYPKTKIINETGEVVAHYQDNVHLQSERPFERYRQLFENLGLCNAQYGVVRSRILKQTRLVGKYIGSDICLLAELSLHGKFWVVPEHLLLRRFHPGCSSFDRNNTKMLLQFYDPEIRREIYSREWRHFFENLLAVGRVPLSLRERMRVVLFQLHNGIMNRDKLVRELIDTLQFYFHRVHLKS